MRTREAALKVKSKSCYSQANAICVLPFGSAIVSDLHSGLLLLRTHQYLLGWSGSSWECYLNTDTLGEKACPLSQYCPVNVYGRPSWSCPCSLPVMRRKLIPTCLSHPECWNEHSKTKPHKYWIHWEQSLNQPFKFIAYLNFTDMALPSKRLNTWQHNFFFHRFIFRTKRA